MKMPLKDIARRYCTRLNTGQRTASSWERPSAAPAAPDKNTPITVNVLLFIVTLFTTTYAGARSGSNFLEYMMSGLSYSLTLLLILTVHEFGHYFAARRFHVRATLPFFIPFPSIIGTMGAVIKTKTPIPDRRALLYVGAMGPIPGFVVSLAAVIIGISLSGVRPLPPSGGAIPVPIFGDSLLFAFIVKAIHGTIPPGYDIYLSPWAWAGWIGFLVTSLNLMPIGQLDGGHILYALLGKKQRYAGWAFLTALVVMSFFWYGWVVWVILTLLFLMVAHPYTPPAEIELTLWERLIGWACMIILVLTFIPVPVDFI